MDPTQIGRLRAALFGCLSASRPLRRRVLRCSVVTALLASLPLSLAGQSAGTVAGRVANAATGVYLENAQVRIVGTDRVTTTLPGGRYQFTGVPAGEVTVSASYAGLDTLAQTVDLPAGGSATLEFNLTSAAYGDKVLQLDEYVVASTREGNARAIVDQREAPNVINVISSDAFGSVSEDNVGEFLKYMSGLSIDYVENDARQVRVRGLSAKYASVSIDGNPVASADFGIATGRSFQFEQVSLSTVDTIEVNKTPLADQPANSLAGTINVKSKSALNQKGRRIRYSGSLTLNEYARTLGETRGWDDELRRKALPNGSLEFSDTFLDGRLGIVASLNHTGTYVEQKLIAGLSRSFNADPADNATEVPRITQVNWQDGLKPTFRDAALLNIDYKFTPDLTLSLRTSYNMYEAPFHNRNWTLNASAATNVFADLSHSSMRTLATSATDTGNNAVIAGTNFRKYGATFNFNPAVSWRISPNLSFEGSLSYSRSYQWYDSDAEGFFNIVSARMRGLNWGYTSSTGEPNLQVTQGAGTFGDTRSWFDLRNYNDSNTAQTAHRDAKDQVYTARADFSWAFPEFRLPAVLKFGADSRTLVKDIENWTKVWSMNVNPAAGGIDLAQYPDLYAPNAAKGQKFTDLAGRIAAQPSLDKWRLYDLFKTYNTDPFTVLTAAQQPFFLTTAQAAANLRNKLQNMWDLEETITSAYLRADLRPSPKLYAVAGLRFEKTETEGRAFDDIGGPAAVAASGTTNTNDFGYIQARFGRRLPKSQEYDDLFPSAMFRYSPRENLNLRLAYHRSILRPDVQNVARSLVVNDTQTTFTTANPALKPEYADNFDARIEYYFEPVGYVSVGFFHKKIKDIQTSLTTDFTLDNVPADIIALGYDPAALVASSADFVTVTNGPETVIQGFELDYAQQLSFLPDPFGGLGVFANYSRNDPDDPRFFVQTFNAGLTYRQGRFNGQVKLNWHDDRLLTAAGANGVDLKEVDRLQIDVNVDYAWHPRATLFLNIANLTNEPAVRYQVHEANLQRHGAFGAKYTLGVKGSF